MSFIFTPNPGELIQLDKCIFQMGTKNLKPPASYFVLFYFNQQVDKCCCSLNVVIC